MIFLQKRYVSIIENLCSMYYKNKAEILDTWHAVTEKCILITCFNVITQNNFYLKVKWMDKMTEARAKIVSGPTKNYSFLDKFKQSIASPPRSPPVSSDFMKNRRARRPQSLKSSHGKSLSMDAVYLWPCLYVNEFKDYLHQLRVILFMLN